MSANRPFVLGLTGGIAGGKSAAAEYLKTLGAQALDADAVSRALTAPGGPGLAPIRAAFGDGVFFANGVLNRKALGDKVFADADKRRALEAILHPMVFRELDRGIARAKARVVVLNVPLLFETGLDKRCDAVWVMAVEPETQVMRLMKRDHLSREQALLRMESQMPQAEKIRRATAAIYTDRPIAETRKELRERYESLMRSLGE